jgi:hypothetical protein
MTVCTAAAQSKPAAQGTAALQTRPERTKFNETSTYDDVVAFMKAASKANPKIHLTTFGYTTEGRPLPLAVIGASAATPEAVRATGKLRVHIQGNIHGGEVEGKESAQILLRELAQGKHADWLQSMVLIIAPIYNADGNERFSLTNRGRQLGPIGGQGQRPNAQGFDLNRDHMKLDSPEARSFVRLMNEYGPAHDQRHAPRVPHHVLAAPQSGNGPGHCRPAARAVAARSDEDGEGQVQLGLLLLRQPAGAVDHTRGA